MDELTKVEEKIMVIYWKLKKAFVKDVISELPEPKGLLHQLASGHHVTRTNHDRAHQDLKKPKEAPAPVHSVMLTNHTVKLKK
jgi:BlaI family transcriptional regulator, penicillinase repressor